MAEIIDMVLGPVFVKVPRKHPDRKLLIACKYYGSKRSIQDLDDEVAATVVGLKFGIPTETLMTAFLGRVMTSSVAKTMASLAVLPDILICARFLAYHGVLRDEDVAKCVRVFVKKHPEINEALQSVGRELESELKRIEDGHRQSSSRG